MILMFKIIKYRSYLVKNSKDYNAGTENPVPASNFSGSGRNRNRAYFFGSGSGSGSGQNGPVPPVPVPQHCYFRKAQDISQFLEKHSMCRYFFKQVLSMSVSFQTSTRYVEIFSDKH